MNRNTYPDGKAYFGVNDPSIAESYSQLRNWDPRVIKVRIPNDVFEREFRQYVPRYDGGPLYQIGVPREVIPG